MFDKLVFDENEGTLNLIADNAELLEDKSMS